MHFNVILPTFYERDLTSVVTTNVHILRLYGKGVWKKMLALRAMSNIGFMWKFIYST